MITLCLCVVSFEQVINEEVDEVETVPVIFEDKDDSEEDESEDDDAMETDQDSKDEEAFDDVSDIEGNDDIMED